jgi:hypothetical protein
MAIKWNHKFNNLLPYNRFETKNCSFLEAVQHGAKIIRQVLARKDVPSNVDVIVLCTGYQATFPFFDDRSHPTVSLHANSPASDCTTSLR